MKTDFGGALSCSKAKIWNTLQLNIELTQIEKVEGFRPGKGRSHQNKQQLNKAAVKSKSKEKMFGDVSESRLDAVIANKGLESKN